MRIPTLMLAGFFAASASAVAAQDTQDDSRVTIDSECYAELQSKVPPLEQSLSGQDKQDLRQLLRPAIILARRGNEAACRAILAEIGRIGQDQALSEQTAAQVQDVPMTPSLRVSVLGDMLDREVLGAGGDDVGEIENILISQGTRDAVYVVIDRDGWFGEGNEQVALPLSALTRSADGEYMVNVPEELFDEAPLFTGAALRAEDFQQIDMFWQQQAQ